MSYSACDFMDDICEAAQNQLGAVLLPPPGDNDYSQSECADIVLAAIDKAQAERQALLAFVQKIARMQTASEFDDANNDEGMSGDDAIDTVSNLVHMARELLRDSGAQS